MFEGTLLDSSTAHRPVLAPADWLAAIAIGLLGFFIGSMKLPVVATPDGTRVLLLRAAVFAGALMFYSLSVCYAFKDARRQGSNARLWAAVVLLSNLPGFLIYLFYSAAKTGEWKRATLPVAYTVQALLVSSAALVPLINIQALPNSWNITKPYLPPSRPIGQAPPHPSGPKVNRPRPYDLLTAPTQIPHGVREVAKAPIQPPDVGVGVSGLPPGVGGPAEGPLIGIFPTNPGPPPEIPMTKPAVTKRIVLGGIVEAAKLIYGPQPQYPPIALMTHVQGMVRIRAVIGTDGTVQELTVLSGHPMLVPAAKDTVARWRYQPTLLNGEPVEVDTEIDVIFRLNE